MFANRKIGGYTVPCVALYIVAIILIILYGYFLRKTKTKDILAKRIYHHPICQEIDGWSITHLVFFGLLGFLYPGHYLQFLAAGIIWEVIETGLGQNRFEVSGKRLQLIGEQDDEGNSTGKKDAYWYGKESDIVVDVVGYTIGSFLAEKFWPNELEVKVRPQTPTPLRA
jgi:hypothetical protein